MIFKSQQSAESYYVEGYSSSLHVMLIWHTAKDKLFEEEVKLQKYLQIEIFYPNFFFKVSRCEITDIGLLRRHMLAKLAVIEATVLNWITVVSSFSH